MELVERPPLGVHLGVVLPRLRDHHQHGVRQRAAAHVQQLEDLVERRGVGRARRADRVEPLEVARDQVGVEQRLAGAHPVAVAHHGVDLAVVGDVAERVGQRPARERVGREPRVHDRQRRGDPLVGQVGEEVVELVGGQHPLVDEGARGERREVDVGLLLGPLAQAERLPLQRHPGDPRAGPGHEDLHERRHRAAGGRAEHVGLHGHLAPAQHLQALLGGDLLEALAGLGHVVGVAGEEAGADGVRVVGRQLEVDHLAQERVRDLDQDPGAVTGVDLGAGGAAVVEVAQRGERLVDDGAAGDAGQGRHEGDATGVVLEARVVETLCWMTLGWLTCGAHVLAPVVDRPRPGEPVSGQAGRRGRRWPRGKRQSSK